MDPKSALGGPKPISRTGGSLAEIEGGTGGPRGPKQPSNCTFPNVRVKRIKCRISENVTKILFGHVCSIPSVPPISCQRPNCLLAPALEY